MFKTFKEKFLLIWVLGIVLYLPLMNNFNAWYDEQYSLYLTSLSWQDMFHAIELEDSHPPMYYIILKLWMMGMDYHLVGWARFSNLVFLALTALLGAFPVRRLAGDKTALWFAALTFFFPASLWLGTNIRMYSLFYLEITAFITYALLILKEGKTKDWAMFLGWGMTLPYTHYYGCFTLAFIYTFLFCIFLYRRINLKRNLIKLCGSGGLTALAFLPWFVFVFLKQASFMNGKWWVTLNHVTDSAAMFVNPYINDANIYTYVITAVFMALCWLLLFQYPCDPQHKSKRLIILLPVSLFIFIMASGTIFSLLFYPVLVWRYMIPFFSGLVLGLSVVLSEEKRFKNIFIILAITCFCGLYFNRYTVVHASLYREIQTYLRKNIPAKESIFLCNNKSACLHLEFYFPEYIWQRVPDKAELSIPQKLMYRQTISDADIENKKILLFEDNPNCEAPRGDRYSGYVNFCLERISETVAKNRLNTAKQIIQEELK